MAFTITGIPILEEAIRRSLPASSTPYGGGWEDVMERRRASREARDAGRPPNAAAGGLGRFLSRTASHVRALESRSRPPKTLTEEQKRALSGDETFWWATEEGRYNYELWRNHFVGLDALSDLRRGRVEKDRVKLNEIAKKLLGDGYFPGAVSALWEEAIAEAHAGSTVGEPRTPWEVLERWSSDPKAFRRESELGAQGPRVSKIEKTIRLTDPRTAGVIVNETLRAYLGRSATDQERADFVAALNAVERENPIVTRSELDDEGNEVTTTTGGSPEPAAFAQSFTEEQHEEEARSFLASSYLDALKGL